MLCKYVLTVDSISYDIPKSCIQNWDEIKFSRKRSGLEGITRTFTSKFQFVGEAYDLILEEYLSKYLASNASISVYTITDSHTYDEFFSCRLDFGSLTYDGNTVSINSIDDSVANIIKANKGTQYEYSVDELKDEARLYYDRLSYVGSATYYCGGRTLESGSILVDAVSGSDHYMTIPMYIGSSEIVPGSGIEVKDVGASGNLESCLIYTEKATSVKISIKGSYSWDGASLSADMQLKTKSGTLLKEWKGGWGGESISVNWDGEVTLSANDGIILLAAYNTKFALYYFSSLKITMEFPSIGLPIDIDAIKPVTILKRLIKSMNGGNDGIDGEISSGIDERLDNCVILTAESIRGIPKAKLYTSYTKFVNWMEAEFGFVPVINGRVVSFRHRNNLFGENNVKDLGGNIADFEYKIEESRIYSRVRVGYDKQEYESMNGRDEFRFTTEYTTGVDITDNVLEFISPYRADAYGIEFLAQNRGKDTTDDESDNDVFFVGATLSPNDKKYKLIRAGWNVDGVLSPDTMFNTMYWQGAMLQANAGYIGMFTNKLSYSSSDGNSDVVVNGIGMKDDFRIESGIITCGDVSFKTFDEEIPPTDDETIKILKDGLVYEGYIKEVSSVVERNEGVKYDLFVCSITKA
ncbi:MAG: hypothetical protein K2P55_17355 [Bacteroides acidifaciens]|uniref:hypothetical protein n=1 Tax=Bacteroides acidifaciens TaxID=85831 RepID=UPI0023D42836|nr:hypothetical protein [Bacteroides acidifaciens]MDE6821216.1 hypothetical protein [Bacteroides acidifaciens]MDE6988622.1 hypothetical protein [Bacteroides acidifaciens]